MTKTASPEPAFFLPLSPAKFYVLVALADGDKHGYAILREVEDLSGGEIRVGASTLYSVLQRLEQEGLIVESEERPDPRLDDQRRRYYRLTSLGRAVGEAEAARLESVLSVVRARRFGDLTAE